jgi:hypothetical protein
MHTQVTFLNSANQWQCWHDRGATAGRSLQRSSWGRECRWRKGFCASGPGASAALPWTDRHTRILGSQRNCHSFTLNYHHRTKDLHVNACNLHYVNSFMTRIYYIGYRYESGSNIFNKVLDQDTAPDKPDQSFYLYGSGSFHVKQKR